MPGGTRYERREGDRHIEFNFKPISDGGILAVFRDITELKEREEALAAAKEDVERTRELMQTILDNMNDGVTLWDKDFIWKFSNREHIERQQYTPDDAAPRRHRLRHDPLPGAARRIRPAGRGRGRKQGAGDRRDHPRSGRRPLRAPHAGAAATSSSPTIRSPTAACSASIATSPS